MNKQKAQTHPHASTYTHTCTTQCRTESGGKPKAKAKDSPQNLCRQLCYATRWFFFFSHTQIFMTTNETPWFINTMWMNTKRSTALSSMFRIHCGVLYVQTWYKGFRGPSAASLYCTNKYTQFTTGVRWDTCELCRCVHVCTRSISTVKHFCPLHRLAVRCQYLHLPVWMCTLYTYVVCLFKVLVFCLFACVFWSCSALSFQATVQNFLNFTKNQLFISVNTQ